MSVEVCVQQGLLGKNRITHHALVDHSAREEEKQLNADVWGAGKGGGGHQKTPYLACPPVSVGCCVLMWLWALGEDLNAMGQLGHLWNTSQ